MVVRVALVQLIFVVWACNAQDLANSCLRSCNQGCTSVTDARKVIYLLSLLPYRDSEPNLNPSWDEGSSVQPAMDLARDQINCNSSILKNYTLELIYGDGGCNLVTKTAVGFTRHTFPLNSNAITGIIGPGCSSSTIALAPLVGRPQVELVMVHGAGSLTLSNRSTYSNLLGSLGSTENFVNGFLSLIKMANWTRIAILYDDSRQYYLNTKRSLVERLSEIVPAVEVRYASAVSFNFIPLNVVREELLRIVFILCPFELTRRIICLSMRNNMVQNKDYQFIIMSHTFDQLISANFSAFQYNDRTYNCSETGFEGAALEMFFLVNYRLMPANRSAATVSNLSYNQYLRDYEEYRACYNVSCESNYTVWASYFYDSVWAWALVLDNLTQEMEDFEVNGDYGNRTRLELIVEQFYRTSFEGVSGTVHFDNRTGFIPRMMDIFQVINGSSLPVFTIDTEGNSDNTSTRAHFYKDYFQNVTLRENAVVGGFFVFSAIIQFGIVIFLHAVTVAYRKKPSIKAVSPKLLHFSYAGIYIMLTGMFLWALNPAASIRVESRHVFCQILWPWCLSLGFTLSFAPVGLRTFRLYRIFQHYRNPGPFISNNFLMGMVIFMGGVDVIVAIAWTVIDPFDVEPFIVVEEREGDVSEVKVRQDCYCNHYFYWYGILYAYKFSVLLAITVLAILTRKITNRSFTTNFLRIHIYLFAIAFTLFFVTYYLLVFARLDDQNSIYSFLLVELFLNVCVLLFVFCVFAPPIVPVFRRYNGPRLKPSGNSGQQILPKSSQ